MLSYFWPLKISNTDAGYSNILNCVIVIRIKSEYMNRKVSASELNEHVKRPAVRTIAVKKKPANLLRLAG